MPSSTEHAVPPKRMRPWELPSTLQNTRAAASWQWGRMPSRFETTGLDTTMLAGLAVRIKGAIL